MHKYKAILDQVLQEISTLGVASALVCPVLGSPAQERYEHT